MLIFLHVSVKANHQNDSYSGRNNHLFMVGHCYTVGRANFLNEALFRGLPLAYKELSHDAIGPLQNHPQPGATTRSTYQSAEPALGSRLQKRSYSPGA